MRLVISKPKFDAWTLIMSAYLINQFYFNAAISIQRIVLLGVLCVYVASNFGILQRLVPRRNFNAANNTLVLFAFWFLIVIITPFFHGSGDYSYVSYCQTYFSWTIYLLAIIIRIAKKRPHEDVFENFMMIFSISILLYVLSTILIIALPSLRNAVQNLVYMDSYTLSVMQKEKYYTRIGWAGFSGYTTSLKCTISVCFMLYLGIRNTATNYKMHFKQMLLYLAAMLGNIFYARTGVIASILCTLLAVAYIAIRLGQFQKFLKWFLVILVGVISFSYYISIYSGENVIFNWILELFISAESGGSKSVISLDIMFDQMLFKPETKTMWLGDGYYTGTGGLSYMSVVDFLK